jgi:hypothetical protein
MPPPPNLEQLLVQIQFPGMPKPESDVCREWITRHGAEYDQIDFNVSLGTGVQLQGDFSQETIDLANQMTKKRADMITWQYGQPAIWEVKIRASLGAVGQLIGYRELFDTTYPGAPEPTLTILARRVDDDTRYVASQQGIDIVLYED